MSSKSLYAVLLIATTWVVNGAAAAPPVPSPSSTDCSSIIFDMFDCVSFLSDGSSVTEPTPDCCSGYQTVVSVDPQCICVAIKSSGDMGIQLNITKAMTLPSACGFPAPPVDCGTASLPPPNSAPAPAPDQGTSPSPANPPSSSSPSPPKESPAPPSDDKPAPPSDGGDNEPAPPSDGGDNEPAPPPAGNDDEEGGSSSEGPAPSASPIKSGGIYSTGVSLVGVISMIVASVSYMTSIV